MVCERSPGCIAMPDSTRSSPLFKNLLFKELGRLALPMVVAQLAFASMGFIDTLLMGQLGVEELAGGGLGSVVFQFCYIVGLGVLVATANLIAYAKGQDNDDEIHRAVLSGAVTVVLLSVFFGLFIWLSPSILLAFGQEAETVVIAERYLVVAVWALLPAFGFILLRSLVLGFGDPSAILPISVAAAALNYPVSYALMTGAFGLPAMGLEGIALGTVIMSTGMLAGLAWMTYRKAQFQAYPFWKGWELFSWQQFGETFRLGVPIAIAHAMEIGMFTAGAIMVGWIGVQALAAHQVALQCTTMTFMIPLGMSQAASVMVGQSYGANDLDKIKQATRTAIIMVTATACLTALLFWFAPEWLVSLFLEEGSSDYAQLVTIAVSILFVAALFQLVDSWQVVIMGVLRGFKLGTSPTLASIVSYWLVGMPAAYYLLTDYHATGVWAGMGIGLAVSSIMLAALYVWMMSRLQKAALTHH